MMIKNKIKLKIVANQNLNRLRKNLIRMESVKTQNLKNKKLVKLKSLSKKFSYLTKTMKT